MLMFIPSITAVTIMLMFIPSITAVIIVIYCYVMLVQGQLRADEIILSKSISISSNVCCIC